ncbi:MAG: gamma-glutamyltransferase [Rhizobiaceae bacterium]
MRGLKASAVLAVLAATLAPPIARAQQATDQYQPENGTGRTQREVVRAKQYMVSAANPIAAEAGRNVLEKGGNAVDAMVAVQLVLGLVEPQSSGLGGGAFALLYDGKSGKLTSFDGRETAPKEATPALFLDGEGKPLKFFDAVVGGRSVGTPGTVRLLADMHARHGRLPWAELFEPAIALADKGFTVSPRLNALISDTADTLYVHEATRDYFLSEEGVPIFVGTLLKNPAYAQTLRAIAVGGADAFYKGEIAGDIVAAVRGATGNPGVLSADDLASYKVIEREPVCVTYRALDVCGMGPPSSGALSIGQILKMVEPYDLKSLGPDSAQSWRLIGDASRLAFADRELYMADADFVKMPKGLTNAAYLAERAKLLDGKQALPADAVKAGEPPSDHAMNLAPGDTIEFPSTSHFSIVDSDGNVVSMTTTIENGFGSRLMVRGFLLNNELTDFSFLPERDGVAVANRVEPGKRPRSSMAPTIVLRDGKPELAIGSPGGSRIIGFVAKTLVAFIDWEMDIQTAISLPHLVNRYGSYDLEEGTSAESLAPDLAALGYEVVARELNSGLHGIAIYADHLEGGADPRREGIAIGK